LPDIALIINILDFNHKHVQSLTKEHLWGLPDNKTNRKRWNLIEAGSQAFLYGYYKEIKGIWVLAEITEKFENHELVSDWVLKPKGFPLQIKLKFLKPIDISDELLNKIKPIKREELFSFFSIPIFKTDRFSLIIFGDRQISGVTYSRSKFLELLEEFRIRNERVEVNRPDHDRIKEILYQMGVLQGKVSAKEYSINNKRLDVVWKKLPNSVPYIAFEIQFGGNIFEALTKLKHAYDLWNSIPVLITDERQAKEAKKWLGGSFHEMSEICKVIIWDKIVELYNRKLGYKQLERELGIT